MKKRNSLILTGLCCLIFACNTKLPDLSDKALVIGDTEAFTIASLDYLERLSPKSNNLSLAEIDANGDGSTDFEVSLTFLYETDFDEEDNFQEYRNTSWTEIRINVINSNFKFYYQEIQDTIFNCYWQSAEFGDYDYTNISFTGNVNHVCEEKYTQSISEVVSGSYLVCLSSSESIDTNLSSNSENQLVCRHDYYKRYDGGGFQHGQTTRDFRHGLRDWSAVNYLIFKYDQSGIEKHGFLEFQLEHLDSYRWALDFLNVGLEK